MNSLHVLFVHGWGFGPGCWHALLDELTPSTQNNSTRFNLGFSGPIRTSFPDDAPFIAVGHSLGFAWLLNELAQQPDRFHAQCRGLVSINGFSRFSQHKTFPAGVPVRIMRRMASQLGSDPAAVLKQFQENSGLLQLGGVPKHSNAEKKRLTKGLSWLEKWDHRQTLDNWSGPLLILASEDDRIVSPTLTQACFSSLDNTKPHWSRTGSHVLPLSRPDWCANHIEDFIQALN
ncbi:MAG: hypothetical protein HQL54_07500 [Magnetococcales bacterium]|nr:hypothetical protein [Magnetococcales bacterium]